MIATVTDLAGAITGAHRTWLAPDGFGKAPVDMPRRAIGGLLGHAVRFGAAEDVPAVGEGIETMLSLRCALPAMPMAAALSANHLAALLLSPTLRRLYIARDADAAGDIALAALTERAEAAGIEALALSPRMGDFNDDLHAFGLSALRAVLRIQLTSQDAVRLMLFAEAGRFERPASGAEVELGPRATSSTNPRGFERSAKGPNDRAVKAAESA